MYVPLWRPRAYLLRTKGAHLSTATWALPAARCQGPALPLHTHWVTTALRNRRSPLGSSKCWACVLNHQVIPPFLSLYRCSMLKRFWNLGANCHHLFSGDCRPPCVVSASLCSELADCGGTQESVGVGSPRGGEDHCTGHTGRPPAAEQCPSRCGGWGVPMNPEWVGSIATQQKL